MLKFGILDVHGTKYNLKIGQKYLVGRKSNEYLHDIEIDDQSVDIKHSVIDLRQSLLQLIDVYSKHGTFVDGLKIESLQSVSLAKTSKIRFGNVETFLQLIFEGDSGYLEERPNSPTKDTSEIICNSPEIVASSSSRLKNTLKSSLTSTPNTTSIPNVPKCDTNFLVPSCLPRTSIGSNNSARSVDSFYIPETQHPAEANSTTDNTGDISIYSNRSKQNSTVDDDDFLIPETQEVATPSIPLQNHARFAFHSDNLNDSPEDKIPSSQFRICTQDFNGSEEVLGNDSDDMLANVPVSLVIPPVVHDTVQINDFDKNNGENEIDNEMSALQWSKKTVEDNVNASVTPDGLFDAIETVSSDLIQGIRKVEEKSPSQCSTPDIFGIFGNPQTDETDLKKLMAGVEKLSNLENKNDTPKEFEQDLLPTQVFIRPIPINKSITKPSLLTPVKENVTPEVDCDLLPATQVFLLPTNKPKTLSPQKNKISAANDNDKPTTSTKSTDSEKNHIFASPHPSPKAQTSPKVKASPRSEPHTQASNDEDDLPPTQVFLRNEHEKVNTPISSNVNFSSTVVDFGMQLSENSFKVKCNKLLDSDDDEMDEVIAPELVKQMRRSGDNLEQPPTTIKTPITPETSLKQIENTAPDQNPPENNNFVIPLKTPKPLPKTPAVSIDYFLLTPDFLNKEFSKNSQLQREADVNWKNIILEKQRRKSLFSEDNEVKDANLANTDSDNSQDSFSDLLPRRRETRSKSVKGNFNEKMDSDQIDKQETVCGRITRRKSASVSDVKKVSKKELKTKDKKSKFSKITEKNAEDNKSDGKSEKKKHHLKNVKDSKVVENSNNEKTTKNDAKVKQDENNSKPKKGNASEKKEKLSKFTVPDVLKIPNESKMDIDNKKIIEKEPPKRITRLQSSSGLKVQVEKKTTRRKKDEAIQKPPTTNDNPLEEQTIDLTDSDAEDSKYRKANKRKSQDDETAVKRSKSTISVSQCSTDSTDFDRTLRRKKKIKIAITSCSQQTKEILIRFSGRIWDYTEDPKECDVLVVEAGNRTYKLLVAISRGVHVVKTSWLKEVLQKHSTDVSFEKHLFEEPNFQKRHHFVMREVLQLARTTSLFGGIKFMMTPNITPKPDEMTDIITCAGGTVLTTIPKSQHDETIYLVSESIDNKHWYKYRRTCKNIKIVTANTLMASVMQQSRDPLDKNIH